MGTVDHSEKGGPSKESTPGNENGFDVHSDSTSCPICFEPWTSGGIHRLVSLKCGHLFGLSCIEKWLKTGPRSKCPKCNAFAMKSDVRPLFVKNPKPLDTSERDKTLNDLEKERELRRSAELEATKTRQKLLQSGQLVKALRSNKGLPVPVPVRVPEPETENKRPKLDQSEPLLKDLENEKKLRMQAELEAANARTKLQQNGQLLKDMEVEKELRRKAELEAENARLKLQESEKLHEDFVKDLSWLQNPSTSRKRACSSQDGYSSATTENPSYVLEKTFDLNKGGGCHSTSPYFTMLVLTQASTNKGFPGYGIRKISTLDLTPAEFILVHQKPVKDLAFHRYDSLVLTASFDKTVQITNVYNNSVTQAYSVDKVPWRCVWDRDNASLFYVGDENGTVFQFDTRINRTYVQQLPHTGHISPVVGLQYMKTRVNSQLSVSGPVALQLSACCFYEKVCCGAGYKAHLLHEPLAAYSGNFNSLCMEPSTGHFLVSCRPTVNHPNMTHMFCGMSCTNPSAEIQATDNVCTLDIIETLCGGEKPPQIGLSRSKAFLNPGDECSVLVCAGDESAGAALIWDVNTGQCLQHLKTDESVLDICNFSANENHFLSTLTERKLRIYKWTN